MSQQKVDYHKEQKRNRRQIMRKEKAMRRLEITVLVVILAALVAWFAYLVYRNVQAKYAAANVTTTEMHLAGWEEYTENLNSLINGEEAAEDAEADVTAEAETEDAAAEATAESTAEAVSESAEDTAAEAEKTEKASEKTEKTAGETEKTADKTTEDTADQSAE